MAPRVEYVEQEVEQPVWTPSQVQDKINELLNKVPIGDHATPSSFPSCRRVHASVEDTSCFRRLKRKNNTRALIRSHRYIMPATTWLQSTRTSGKPLDMSQLAKYGIAQYDPMPLSGGQLEVTDADQKIKIKFNSSAEIPIESKKSTKVKFDTKEFGAFIEDTIIIHVIVDKHHRVKDFYFFY